VLHTDDRAIFIDPDQLPDLRRIDCGGNQPPTSLDEPGRA
jgi:hypothetical protein